MKRLPPFVRRNQPLKLLALISVLAAFSIGLAAFAMIGPPLHRVVVGLVTNSSSALFDAANGGDFVEVSKISSWFVSSITNWTAWATAAPMVFVAARTHQIRTSYVTSSTAGIAVLFIAGSIESFRQGTKTVGAFLDVGLTALLGGLILGAILALLLHIASGASLLLQPRSKLRLFVACALPILLGLTSNILAFAVFRFFLGPIPIHVDATFASPAGLYVPEVRPKLASENPLLPDFAPIPEFVDGSPLWLNIAAGAARVDWVDYSDAKSGDVEVRLFSGCTAYVDTVPVSRGAAAWTFPSGGRLNIQMDAGSSMMQFPRVTIASRQIAVEEQKWLAQVESYDEGKRASATMLFTPSGRLVIRSTERETTLFILMILAQADTSEGRVTPAIARRTLTINSASGQKRSSNLSTGEHIDGSRRAKCAPVASLPVEADRSAITTKELLVAAVVKIRQPDRPFEEMFNTYSKLRVTGAGGWYLAPSLLSEALSKSNPVGVRQVQVAGLAENVDTVPEVKVSRRATEWAFEGVLYISYDRLGHLRVRGETSQAFADGARLNPTQWEQLGREIQAVVLGGVGAVFLALGWLGRKLIDALRRDDRIGLFD